MEFLIALLIAFALLVLLAVLLFRSGGLKSGKLPNGRKPNPLNGQFIETWVAPPTSVPNGTQKTFTFTVTYSAGGTPQAVGNREYLFVVQPKANLTIISANGAAINGDRATVNTDNAGRIDLVIRTDAPSENPAGVLAGRTTQQIRQGLLRAVFSIPGQ